MTIKFDIYSLVLSETLLLENKAERIISDKRIMIRGSLYMLFIIYPMFVIWKIAKNSFTCFKSNEWPVPTSWKLSQKNSIAIECSLFVISYCLLFLIRYLVLQAQIIWITNSEYSITTSFFRKFFKFYEPFANFSFISLDAIYILLSISSKNWERQIPVRFYRFVCLYCLSQEIDK